MLSSARKALKATSSHFDIAMTHSRNIQVRQDDIHMGPRYCHVVCFHIRLANVCTLSRRRLPVPVSYNELNHHSPQVSCVHTGKKNIHIRDFLNTKFWSTKGLMSTCVDSDISVTVPKLKTNDLKCGHHSQHNHLMVKR